MDGWSWLYYFWTSSFRKFGIDPIVECLHMVTFMDCPFACILQWILIDFLKTSSRENVFGDQLVLPLTN